MSDHQPSRRMQSAICIILVIAFASAYPSGAMAGASERVLTATAQLRPVDNNNERNSVSITLRVRAECVAAYHPGPEKGSIIVKAVMGDKPCVLSPAQSELIAATRQEPIGFLAHPSGIFPIPTRTQPTFLFSTHWL